MRIFFTDSRGNPMFLGGFRRHRHYHSLQYGPFSTKPIAVAPSRTTLFFYVLNRNWEWVLRRCRTHPHEIGQFDSRTGDMPLHAACRLNPPADVVRALLQSSSLTVPASASPEAAAGSPASETPTGTSNSSPRRFSFSASLHKTILAHAVARRPEEEENNDESAPRLICNKDGWTALHIAASNHCTRQVLEVLVQHCPTAVKQRTRQTQRTPIHCASVSFRGLDRDAFFFLLNTSLQYQVVPHQLQRQRKDVNEFELEDELGLDSNHHSPNHSGNTANDSSNEPQNLLCLKDASGQTPLALLFRRYRERVQHVCTQMDARKLSREEALRMVQTELGPLWEKARGMVERLSAVLSAQGEDKRCGLAVTGNTKTVYPSYPAAYATGRPRGDGRMETDHDSDSENEEDNGPLLPRSRRRQLGLSSVLKTRRRKLQGRRFRLVHASVGLIGFGCPPEMIRLAVSLYPHQAAEVDEDGYLPIHIAAMKFQEQAAAVAASAQQQQQQGLDDSSLHTNASNSVSNWETLSAFSEGATSASVASTLAGFSNRKSPWDQVFDMLLQNFPEGAKMSRQTHHKSKKNEESSTLPLVMAMKDSLWTHSMSWRLDGLERLMHAHPPALHLVLEVSGSNGGGGTMYPHLLNLLLAKDFASNNNSPYARKFGRRGRVSNSIRWNARERHRTPLDVARMSAVFCLLQTKPEMVCHGLESGKFVSSGDCVQ